MVAQSKTDYETAQKEVKTLGLPPEVLESKKMALDAAEKIAKQVDAVK